MSQTINRFALLLVIWVASVAVTANTAVPVTDLVNNTATQPTVTPQPLLPKLADPVKVDLVANTAKANANAQIFDLVELLQQEVQQLRGKVEELNYDLGRLKQDQKQRYLDLDRRIVSLSSAPRVEKETQVASAVSPITQANSAITQASDVNAASDAAPAPQPAVTRTPNDPEAANAAYKAAFALIRKRQYDASIVALLDFVKNFPQSDLVGNAHYWLGEVYMVQGDASLAALSFEYVIFEFPQHRKIPDALYKAGVAYQNTGDVDKANQLLQRVSVEYPESSAARLALERVN